MGCDTLVALGAVTRDGVTLFGKNSDRPPDECQRIVQIPHAEHVPGSMLRCQYLAIPQVAETAAVVGSQPHWLWGFEHGVNEHRVAIGNEMVFAKEALAATGLCGMDLVRLGLERACCADEALAVITGLIERWGQGGSGQRDVEWPYHNAFLIADPHRAWVLETSARHWVAQPVRDTANISNGLGIGTEWTRGTPDVTDFAIERGWWSAERGRLDFARAYAEQTGVPENLCAARRARLGALLAESRGQMTAASVRGMLRDHYADRVHVPRPFEHAQHFAVCMHSPGLSHTTASMVASLAAPDDRAGPMWICLGNPCLGVFLPLYPSARIPPRLALGGAEADDASPWWAMHRLRRLVERDPARLAARVRARWDELESELVREAAQLDEAAAPTVVLEAFMERAVAACLDSARRLARECGS